MRGSLVDGAKQALAVGIACAIVGVIIGVLTLTGAASNFAGFVLEIGAKSLFLSLFLTMVVCLVLGMGIPTIPNYIITSAIAAPALLKLGVPLIVSHMFVFYFGIMADLTPPVALAAFAAASIAKASPMRIGWKATHIAIAGFVIPYMAVYDPGADAAGRNARSTPSYVVFKAIVAIGLWGGAAVGYLRGPLNWPERIFAAAAAFLLVAAIPLDRRGRLRACAAFVAWHWYRTRARRAAKTRRECGLPARRRRRSRHAAQPTEFTLAWEHSVEKTRWEESYRVDGDRLRLTAARIQGLGAGMEPPPDAVLRGGWWTWKPPPHAIAVVAADAIHLHVGLDPVLEPPLPHARRARAIRSGRQRRGSGRLPGIRLLRRGPPGFRRCVRISRQRQRDALAASQRQSRQSIPQPPLFQLTVTLIDAAEARR